MQTILSLLSFARPGSKLVGGPLEPATTTECDIAPAIDLAAELSVAPSVPRVTATELWRMFDTNEADAEHRFAHRPLYVSGAVERVARRGAEYVVELSVSGTLSATVRCCVSDAKRSNVEQLRQGDLVMVLGRRIFRDRGHLTLEDGLVVEDDLTVLPLRPLL